MRARRLYYTPGSPFGRAVRIILDELKLDYQADIADISDGRVQRSKYAPTLQVPVFKDSEVTIWDSSLIVDYLFANYPDRADLPQAPVLASRIFRSEHEWEDKNLFASVQTFGQSTVLISQMLWSGISANDSKHIALNVGRLHNLLDWFETQMIDAKNGFLPNALSAQDIFLICHLAFICHRPLNIEWDRTRTPKLAALYDRLSERTSFLTNPIEWWEPNPAH